MKLYAPVDGVIAQRTVQVGQQVAAGTPLMAVVPLDTVWVDANFKEGQLRDMRIGQPVTVTADIYGGSVTYHGRVLGLGAGSGSAFALLPPQNASGNWIKIVQRVPVRIALDPTELRDHPLRVGLSVNVNVDISDISGASIGAASNHHEVAWLCRRLRRSRGQPHDPADPRRRTARANAMSAPPEPPRSRRPWSACRLRSRRSRWRWARSCRCWTRPSRMCRCPPSRAISALPPIRAHGSSPPSRWPMAWRCR